MIVLSFATGVCLSFSSLISFLPGGTELYKQLSLLTVYLKTLIATESELQHSPPKFGNSKLGSLSDRQDYWRVLTQTSVKLWFWFPLLTPRSIFVLFWSFSVSPGLPALFMEKPHLWLINRFIQSSERECCAWMPAFVARWVTSLSFLVNCPFNAELINHTCRPCKHIFLLHLVPFESVWHICKSSGLNDRELGEMPNWNKWVLISARVFISFSGAPSQTCVSCNRATEN